MDKILVPTDFSKNADIALRYAANMLKDKEGELCLVHAYNVPSSTAGMLVSLRRKMEEQAMEQMERLKGRLQEMDAEFHLSYAVVEGSHARAIVDHAEEIEASMIVMGTKGASGLEEIFIGSIASAVIEHAPIPVLAVPVGAEFQGWKRVIYATDLGNGSEAVAHKLVSFTERFNSEIHVVHVHQEGEEDHIMALNRFVAGMQDNIENRSLSCHLHANDSIRDGLLDFLGEHEGEVLVMVTRKRNLIQKLFDRSLTKKIAMEANIPLLAYHAPN